MIRQGIKEKERKDKFKGRVFQLFVDTDMSEILMSKDLDSSTPSPIHI